MNGCATIKHGLALTVGSLVNLHGSATIKHG